MHPRVSIVILNWNRWSDTLECLESIYQINYPNFDVIVVDNASEDDSLKKIRDYSQGLIEVDSKIFDSKPQNKPLNLFEFIETPKNFKDNDKKDELSYTLKYVNSLIVNTPNDYLYQLNTMSSTQKLIILENQANYGYTRGNNFAIEFALKNLDPDYIMLLNEDTVVHEDILKELVNAGEQDAEIGVLTPKVYYYDYDGRTDVISHAGETLNLYTSRGKRFCKAKIDKGQCDHPRIVDTIEGCSIMFKKDVLLEVGLIDPIYWAYWEDTDLCLRIRNQGYKLLCVPQACIWHKEGIKWENYFSYYIMYHYVVRNRLIFMWRYASSLQKTVFSVYFVFYIMANLLLMVLTQKRETSKEGFKAVRDGIRDFRAVD